jgi:hypothetical protein
MRSQMKPNGEHEHVLQLSDLDCRALTTKDAGESGHQLIRVSMVQQGKELLGEHRCLVINIKDGDERGSP